MQTRLRAPVRKKWESRDPALSRGSTVYDHQHQQQHHRRSKNLEQSAIESDVIKVYPII